MKWFINDSPFMLKFQFWAFGSGRTNIGWVRNYSGPGVIS